jgi:hypothetical protein
LEVLVEAGDFDFGSAEVHFTGDDVEVFDGGFLDEGGQFGFTEQGAIGAGAGLFFEAEPTGGIGLGVAINQEDALADGGQTGGEVDGGGCFTDATFLVGDT